MKRLLQKWLLKFCVLGIGFLGGFFVCGESALVLAQSSATPAVFQGELQKLDQNNVLKFVLDLADRGKASFVTQLMSGQDFSVVANLEHLRWGPWNIVANFETKGEFIAQGSGDSAFIQGNGSVKNFLLNDKPVYDLNIYYEVFPSSSKSPDYRV